MSRGEINSRALSGGGEIAAGTQDRLTVRPAKTGYPFRVTASMSHRAAAHGSITLLLAQLQGCDPSALGEIWRRFFPRLAGLARKTLSGLPRCHADADDVAQSALVSFWRAIERGRAFELADREDLWNLLGVMTVRKARRQVRRESAQKRGGGRTYRESDLGAGGSDECSLAGLDQLLADTPPTEFDLYCEELLLALDDDLRTAAVLRLQGHSTAEIAGLLECNQRSVQRRLEDVRKQWEAMSAE
jgi:DNA-directed RNA polymerase specialized sigma24 family protein